MKLLRRSCSLVLTAVLLALLLPVVPASARPYRASRPVTSMVHAATVRKLAADDDFPGVAITPSPIHDTLDATNMDFPADGNDVWAIHLTAGQTLEVTVDGPTGDNQFAAFVYQAPDWEADPVAWTQGPTDAGDAVATQTLSYTAGTTGTYYLDIWAVWGAGAYTATYNVVQPPLPMTRLAGAGRYATALAISKEWAAGSSPTVILATGADFADGLAASALSGSYGCPVLLTKPDKLPDGLPDGGVLGEIDRLRGSAKAKVFIVGSENAVSGTVEKSLIAHGNITVQRLGGASRYETAVLISSEMKRHETVDLKHAWSGNAWIVKGGDFPDALAAAPIASNMKMPVLLVKPTEIPKATADAIKSLSIKHAYVTGSKLAINDYVASHLGVTFTRLEGAAGSGRYGTAAKIAEYAVSKGWASPSVVGLATGAKFPDALGGSALVGHKGGVILLVNPKDYVSPFSADPPLWMSWVWNHQTDVNGSMYAFGDNSVVSDWVFGDFLWALQP